MPQKSAKPRARPPLGQRQVHLWLSEDDYAFLSELAADDGESVSAFVRRLIRQWRRQQRPRTDRRKSPRRGPPA